MTVRISDTTWMDATAQADLIQRGEASPKELTEAAIAQIEAVNPRLDAVIRTRFDAARQEADGDLERTFRDVLRAPKCRLACPHRSSNEAA